MKTILDEIVSAKRNEIAAAKQEIPPNELRARLPDAPAVRDFCQPLAAAGKVSLIAEVKKASPSKGVIRQDFDPVAIARQYQQAGADCISVLTDEQFFQGKLDYLSQIRRTVDLPLLRKDFILDSYQLLQARVAGADAVLLIAECLDDCHLRRFVAEAIELGMAALVEFYDQENCERAVDSGSDLLGVNNRDLRTFEVDLDHSLRMREQVPHDVTLVSESGIHTPADVAALRAAGIDAMLVGEHLMSQSDVAAAVAKLIRH